MVATFRILLPLLFVIEGISWHSFLLDLNGKLHTLFILFAHSCFARIGTITDRIYSVCDEDMQPVHLGFSSFFLCTGKQ